VLIAFGAILPIAILIFLSSLSKRGFLFSVVISLFFLLAISFFVWQMPVMVLLASLLKGFFLALEIAGIIFGALLLFGVFRRLGGGQSSKAVFGRLSSDYRVKAVLVAWAFVHFIEGVSGFGTPAMIASPILVSIGFSPVAAVIMSLLGDSVPVIFGAVGLPVTYGLASVVGWPLAMDAAGIIAVLNIIMSLLVVVAVLAVAVRDKKGAFTDVIKKIPFAIFASLAVSVPAFITFKLFGPELPSIAGGIFGILFISLWALARYKKENNKDISVKKSDIIPFLPYFLAVFVLALTRIPALRIFLTEAVNWNMPSILNTPISHLFSPLYSPALIFVLVAIIFCLNLWIKGDRKSVKEVVFGAFKEIKKPFITLVLILSFVQIMMNSGINGSGLASMTEAIVKPLEGANPIFLSFASPAIGALGAFVAGSSTVSNLLFSSIQQSAGIFSGIRESVMLAMQGMGSAAGNMISIHNILAAITVAGATVAMERKVLRSNLPFLALYIFILGLAGFILSVVLY
jgi:lactate permease